MLCKKSFAENVFFTNSGTESIECGLKIIRISFSHKTGKTEIISFDGAFHEELWGIIRSKK